MSYPINVIRSVDTDELGERAVSKALSCMVVNSLWLSKNRDNEMKTKSVINWRSI